MNLLVDVGNRRLKWCVAKQVNTLSHSVDWRERAWADTLLAAWSDLAPEGIFCSNVGGAKVEAAIKEFCLMHWGKDAQFIRSEAEAMGLRSYYRVPGQLGADRWAAMLGAVSLSGEPLLVLDCGTAATVDLVDADRRHRGGAIFPGLATMRESLRRSAANLDVDAEPSSAFADNTGAAIEGGTLQALIGALNHYVELARQHLGAEPAVYLCGGDATAVLDHMDARVRHEPNLVLKGLMYRFGIQ